MFDILFGGCSGRCNCRFDPAQIQRLEAMITMKFAQVTEELNATAARVAKIGTETQALLAKIDELSDAITSADSVPQEVADALAALQAQVAVVDDLVADAPAPEPEPED
ncbi:MAG: hypothetical protein AMXMBFR78_33860 [Rubrivivax sp.]